MSNSMNDLFDDPQLVCKIKDRLPRLFQLAEIECSRDGKIGMQVGSLRENIVIALLIHKFGETVVDSNIPITEAITKTRNRQIHGIELLSNLEN